MMLTSPFHGLRTCTKYVLIITCRIWGNEARLQDSLVRLDARMCTTNSGSAFHPKGLLREQDVAAHRPLMLLSLSIPQRSGTYH